MKYILVINYFLAFCLVFQNQIQVDAFVSNLINGATNLASNVVGGVVNGVNTAVDKVVNTVTGTVNTVQNTINTVNLGSQFLWDNALKPSLDVLQNSRKKLRRYFKIVYFISFKTTILN